MTNKKTSNHKVEKGVAIGAGIAVVSVAAIAAVLLLGKNGKKNQKNLKDWSKKMKDEIIEKVKDLKTVSAPMYTEIVNQVAKKYAAVKEISKDELQKEVQLLKNEWKSALKCAQEEAEIKAKTMKKSVKKLPGILK